MTSTTTATKVTRLPRLSIYDIKREHERRAAEEGKPAFYFSPDTLRFFGQTLRAFKVVRNFERGTYTISAARWYEFPNGTRTMGTTVAEYNPKTNTIKSVNQ